MTIGQAISYCYSNYANFNGRGSRPQFWWFYLYNLVIGIVLYLIDRWLFNGSVILSLLWALANIVPLYAAGSRRMHDTGRSGWMQLLVLVPCVGGIIVLIFWAQPSQPAANPYGEAAV